MHIKTTFSQSLKQKQKPTFGETLKKEIATLESGALPLQKAVTQGGYVNDSNLSCTILSCNETANEIRSKLGVFLPK